MTFSAEETIRQLGGRRFIAMTGARNFVKGKNFIMFKLPNAKNAIKYVKIILNPMDTYDIEFKKASGKIVEKEYDVYFDELQRVFTRNTGLDTRL